MAELHAKIVGARELAGRMATAAHELPQITQQEMGGRLASGLRSAYRRVAPVGRTHKLRDKLDTEHRGMELKVISPVTSEEGFHYTRITREGHRVDRIYARPGHALRFVIGGRTIFRKSVRGYHPDHDWAKDAVPQAQHEARTSVQAIGRTAVQRIGGR